MITRTTEMNLFQLQGLIRDETLKNLLYGVYSLVEKYIRVRHSFAAKETENAIFTLYGLIMNSKTLEEYVDRINDKEEAVIIGKLIIDVAHDLIEVGAE